MNPGKQAIFLGRLCPGTFRNLLNVQTSQVDLTVYHGQYKSETATQPASKPVSELNERLLGSTKNILLPAFKATGAFTVANLNDSDADKTPDNIDNNVPVRDGADYAGSGEVDLMRLVLSKPTPVPGKDSITISVASSTTPNVVPAVALWKLPTKGEQPVPFDKQGKVTIPVGQIPDALWFEFTGISLNIGDVTIKMEYNGASDTVAATGIWAKSNPNEAHGWPDGYFMNSNNAEGLRILGGGRRYLPVDADRITLARLFVTAGRSLGISPRVEAESGEFRYPDSEVAKFTLLPSGLARYSVLGVVSIDTTRSNAIKGHLRAYAGDSPENLTFEKKMPPWPDVATDESTQVGSDGFLSADQDTNLLYMMNNDQISTTDNVYYLDSPGLDYYTAKAAGVFQVFNDGKWHRVTENLRRDNYLDFVRIRFGTSWVPTSGVQGSRSSVLFQWSHMQHLKEDPPAVAGGVYHLKRVNEFTVAGITISDTIVENRIEKGHVDLDVPGGGITP